MSFWSFLTKKRGGQLPQSVVPTATQASQPAVSRTDWNEHYRSYSWEQLDADYKSVMLSQSADKDARIAAIIRRKAEMGKSENNPLKMLMANAEALSHQQRLRR